MNWGSIFNRNPATSVESPNIPGITPLQQQRLKQIESLRTFNQNVKEDAWDKEYSIEFNAGGHLFKLCITLPSQFPHERPSVHISPGGAHPWLDERMNVTGCTSLNKFYMHSNLGKVIRTLIDDFKANPPQITPVNKSFGENSYQSCTDLTPSPPTAILISTELVEEEPNVKPTKNPDACTTIAELMDSLSSLSIGDLEKLSGDSTELFKYVMNMDSIKRLQEKRKTLIEKNREQAEKNLSDKPKIQDLQQSIVAKHREMQDLEAQLITNIAKQDEMYQVFDFAQIVTNMRIAISQAEEESEEVAERFLEKKMPVDEFLRRYLETRKLSHLRKAKEERVRYLYPRF